MLRRYRSRPSEATTGVLLDITGGAGAVDSLFGGFIQPPDLGRSLRQHHAMLRRYQSKTSDTQEVALLAGIVGMEIPLYELVQGAFFYGLDITSSGSAHTKGSYAQLTAATSWNSSWQLAQMIRSNVSRSFLVDFATGAAASEVVFLANLYGAAANDYTGPGMVAVESNFDIASGTRISTRCQANVGTSICCVPLLLRNRALGGYTAQSTYGATTGTSRGTAIDPGAVANTYGAYVQMTASTAATHTRLSTIVNLQINTAPRFSAWNFNVSTGAAASEVVLLPDLMCVSSDLGGDQMLPQSWIHDVNIASGTRIAVNAKCSHTDATDRVFDCVLYGSK
jgi:hypothetical protein